MEQLNTYLSNKYPDIYVTGDDVNSLLIWGRGRSDGNVLPSLITLTVALDYNALTSEKPDIIYVADRLWKSGKTAFNRLYKCARYISARTGFPMTIIFFPQSADLSLSPDTVRFLVISSTDSKDMRYSRLLDGKSLKALLYQHLNITDTIAGTRKEKNKSTADFFHEWSRMYLSPSIIKLDIDGMFVKTSDWVSDIDKILIEIKRSNIPPIPQWRPFKDDMPDFMLLLALSRRISSDMWILHHDGLRDCADDTIVSLFIVKDIIGNQLIYREMHPSIKLAGNNSIDSIIRTTLNL